MSRNGPRERTTYHARMDGPGRVRRAARSDPVVRRIAGAWRRLTGGRTVRDAHRRTLVACSGGADSSALVLALAAAGGAAGAVVVGHVRHDLRSAEEADRDLEAARTLAGALGLEFASTRVNVLALPGNAEDNARRARYDALAEMARAHGCGHVATGHHADDQLESVVMALMRGAGPSGLGGMAERRVLRTGGSMGSVADGEPASAGVVVLVRPMLGVTRREARDLCRRCGWEWREDRTNEDEGRLRAAVRRRVGPVLEEIRPGTALRVSRSAALVREAAGLVRRRALRLVEAGGSAGAGPGPAGGGRMLRWARGTLARQPAVVVGEALRLGAGRLRAGRGLDRLTRAAVDPVVRAVRDGSTEPREFRWASVRVRVTAREVTMEAG